MTVLGWLAPATFAGAPCPGVACAPLLISVAGGGFFLLPNKGDQANPMRGAKFKLLLMLLWFSYRSPGEMVRFGRSFQSSCT